MSTIKWKSLQASAGAVIALTHRPPKVAKAMKKVMIAITMAVAFLSLPTTSQADLMFRAELTNDQEAPPAVPTVDGTSTPRPASFGFATFVLNDAMTELTISATVFNIDFGRVPSQGMPVVPATLPNPNPQTAILNDDLLVAHIHRGGPVGTGPVIFGFIGSPFNDTMPNDVVVTRFASGVGGTVTSRWNGTEGQGTTLTAELGNLLAGNTYINFHTIQFGGGEIRGRILLVPEPSSFVLSALGILSLVGYRWRRRQPAA